MSFREYPPHPIYHKLTKWLGSFILGTLEPSWRLLQEAIQLLPLATSGNVINKDRHLEWKKKRQTSGELSIARFIQTVQTEIWQPLATMVCSGSHHSLQLGIVTQGRKSVWNILTTDPEIPKGEH